MLVICFLKAKYEQKGRVTQINRLNMNLFTMLSFPKVRT